MIAESLEMTEKIGSEQLNVSAARVVVRSLGRKHNKTGKKVRFEEEFDDETKVIEESTIDQIGRGSTRENIFQECSVVGEQSEMILVAEESEEITIEEADTTDLEEASEAQISSTEIVVEDLLPDVVPPSIKLIVFNILLPTVDIFPDSALVQKLFLNGYWGCGAAVIGRVAKCHG